MSEINAGVQSFEMDHGKREIKLTAKALANKIERLQQERKTVVNKIKTLIPKMKSLMQTRHNVSDVQHKMESLIQLCETATLSHNTLIPLLPEDEQNKQKDWFVSIMEYSNTFHKTVKQWLDGPEELLQNVGCDPDEQASHSLKMAEPQVEMQVHPFIDTHEIQDDVSPSDSVSNVENRVTGAQSSTVGMKSSVSSTASARLKAEADLAALMTRQRRLQQKHQLEEEEQRLRKRKEQFQLEEEIAAHTAKLTVLRSHSSVSGKNSTRKNADGMNSYLEKEQPKARILSPNAPCFLPQITQKELKNNLGDPATKPKERTFQFVNSEPVPSKNHLSMQRPLQPNIHQRAQAYGDTLNVSSGQEYDDGNMLGIMRKQNEITTLLLKQQCVSSLPKREIPVFSGDPLQYHAFLKAFENGVERNTDSYSDRLYFLEQYTSSHPRELVRSCQHLDPARGYVKAKMLLTEQFGNEHMIAHAYMEKALSWSVIKNEDVKALQDYGLFLRGCSNVMEGVQYMRELDLPSNMLTIIKKLPFRLRDKWRTAACELQERRSQRATFEDIVKFIEKQVRILNDPVFGNIQDAPSLTTKGANKPKSQSLSRHGGAAFATAVAPVEKKTKHLNKGKEYVHNARRMCLCCGEGHALDSCQQLEKRPHKEKIGFLREKGVCFGCLCIGHISKDCKRRISCQKCGLKHPTLLHIPPKEREKDCEQMEQKPEVAVDGTLMSSGLTGAGDHDCKLPIVPVQVKAKKGAKTVLTYAFLDQGSTAVFCTEGLMYKLGLTGKKANILLRTMGQEKVVSSHIVSGLEVAGLKEETFCELPKVYTQERMPVHKGNIPRQKDLQGWTHLR